MVKKKAGEVMTEKPVKGIRGLTITECFKTSDGEMFDKLGDAKEHQIRFNFCQSLANHLETLDIGSDDCNITTDTIMEDLNGLAYVFELYTQERNANA